MIKGFTAGVGLEVTMKLGSGDKCFEFVKPSYYLGVTEEYDAQEEHAPTEDEVKEKMTFWHKELRRLVETEIDVDIYDVKQVKLFEEILYKKGGK